MASLDEANRLAVEGDLARALEQYTTLIDEDDTNAELLLKRASVYSSSHKFTEALQDVKSACAAAPKDPRCFAQLAKLYEQMKQPKAALEAYASYTAAGGDVQAIQEGLRRCQQQAGVDSAPQVPPPTTFQPNAQAAPKQDWYQ
ncbi:TPR repeat-containing protein, partial [Monosiga brevicollis MX1]